MNFETLKQYMDASEIVCYVRGTFRKLVRDVFRHRTEANWVFDDIEITGDTFKLTVEEVIMGEGEYYVFKDIPLSLIEDYFNNEEEANAVKLREWIDADLERRRKEIEEQERLEAEQEAAKEKQDRYAQYLELAKEFGPIGENK